jgi:hypothetical protein
VELKLYVLANMKNTKKQSVINGKLNGEQAIVELIESSRVLRERGADLADELRATVQRILKSASACGLDRR